MTKAELISAIIDAPLDALVYVDSNDSVLRSHTNAAVEDVDGVKVIIVSFEDVAA